MSVYVDEVKRHGTNLRYKLWSHMFADTKEELHAMAEKLKLKRAWYQDHDARPSRHHYDITPPKRREAVRLGAIEVTTREYLTKLLKTERRVERLDESIDSNVR